MNFKTKSSKTPPENKQLHLAIHGRNRTGQVSCVDHTNNFLFISRLQHSIEDIHRRPTASHGRHPHSVPAVILGLLLPGVALSREIIILSFAPFLHKPIRNPKLNSSAYTINRANWKAKGETRKKNGAGSALLFTKYYAYRSRKSRRLIGLKKIASRSRSFLCQKTIHQKE